MSAVAYWGVWLIGSLLVRLLFRFRTVGARHVPTRGGVLIAVNHASYLDIPLVGCGLRRRAWYLGRQDLFGPRWVKAICRWLGWIPIRLSRLDREGFGQAVKLIKDGQAVVIYPEGGRTLDGRLRPGKPGIGVIVEQTGCPVVPAYIAGAYEVLPVDAVWVRFRPVRVTFGKPIDFTSDAQRLTGKDFYRHVSRTVMERIAELGQVSPPVDQAARSAARPLNAE
ncbi:MAG: 1-acyl-sn-glycerol-3-phosphate acyltransferase [Nitrospira sp.]|nr:1-acyl-sn-glycerol-3-phosphate acyltransferase [Nitrospira sp.]